MTNIILETQQVLPPEIWAAIAGGITAIIGVLIRWIERQTIKGKVDAVHEALTAAKDVAQSDTTKERIDDAMTSLNKISKPKNGTDK